MRNLFPISVAILVLSCSSAKNGAPTKMEGAPPQCPSIVEPCGGDLVGTWQFSTACARIMPSSGGLPCEIFGTAQIPGTVSFRADGTYQFNITGLSISESSDISCVTSHGDACNDVHCGVTDGFCSCVMSAADDVSSGTYVAKDMELSMAKNADEGSMTTDATSISYCIQGQSLTLLAMPRSNTTGVTQVVIAATRTD
jgi:hypothetical protein